MKQNCVVCKFICKFPLETRKNGCNIYKCPRCSLYFVYPQPSDSQLAKLYSTEKGYFEHSRITKDYLKEELRIRLNWLADGDARGKKLLDVGSGNGSFIYHANVMGFEELGLEINKGMVLHARSEGLKVEECTLENLRAPRESFDAIHLGDIIEHVRDPEAFLSRCHTLLKKHGRLIINTPNTNSFFARYQLMLSKLFGIPWGHISPPYHLFEFSNTNLGELLARLDFEVIAVTYSPISFQYSLGNTGLFNEFKKSYKQSGSRVRALKVQGLRKIGVIGIVGFLYLFGYALSKIYNLSSPEKNSMTFFIEKP